MIHSTSSSERAGGTDAISLKAQQQPAGSPRPRPDRVSTENADNLRHALASQPEVRPEVVARGQALAADPNYPSPEIMGRIAGMILNSPDLSEDAS